MCIRDRSVPSPIPLINNSVISNIGVLISLMDALASCSNKIFSTFCHFINWSGNKSTVPLRFFRLFKVLENNSKFLIQLEINLWLVVLWDNFNLTFRKSIGNKKK